MTFGSYQFTCAICRRDVHDIDRNGRDRHLSPLCKGCEVVVSYGGCGLGRREGRVLHGAFMDRRKASQIHALSDALYGEAARQQWSAPHDRA